MKKLMMLVVVLGLQAQELSLYDQTVIRNNVSFVQTLIKTDNKYNDLIKKFGEELNQWVAVKRNLVAAKGRAPQEKAQWKHVVMSFEELQQHERSWEDVRVKFEEFRKAVENE